MDNPKLPINIDYFNYATNLIKVKIKKTAIKPHAISLSRLIFLPVLKLNSKSTILYIISYYKCEFFLENQLI